MTSASELFPLTPLDVVHPAESLVVRPNDFMAMSVYAEASNRTHSSHSSATPLPSFPPFFGFFTIIGHTSKTFMMYSAPAAT